ncbi:MAG: MerC domain-containing protein [Halieaceae bacterium]|jgi:hypothetical protein|nr:MerC domain-containing protein [Halieaceae bacterium]
MTALSDSLQPAADRTAIGLSLLCAAHCLLLPIAVAFSPTIAGLGIDDETVHLWMLFGVVPISAFALFTGCMKHRHFSILALGLVGVFLLGLAAVLGVETLGTTSEKAMTLSGASLLALSHLRNFRACQSSSECACSGAAAPEETAGSAPSDD